MTHNSIMVRTIIFVFFCENKFILLPHLKFSNLRLFYSIKRNRVYNKKKNRIKKKLTTAVNIMSKNDLLDRHP